MAGSAWTRFPAHRLLGREPAAFRDEVVPAITAGKIEGWRYRQDLVLLYLLARDVSAPGVVLEIGSFKGLATTTLAIGARSGGRPGVHTVDPHTGDRQDLERRGIDELSSEQQFRANLEAGGVADEVQSYTMTSDELSTQWDGGQIRLLFIDGWHSYEAVASDISNWAPRLAPGGVVVIDDDRNYDDVRAAIDDHAHLLPQHLRRAGRMRLAHSEPLTQEAERYLQIPWG